MDTISFPTLFESLRLNLVLWRIRCLLKNPRQCFSPPIWIPPPKIFGSSFLEMLATKEWKQREPWGWLLEWDWESWNLLAAKGNGSAKLAILKRSGLTLANQRQIGLALFTAPWVMASRTKNAYNGNGMDLRQQGQEWGRKKKGKWMCMPTVAFEVP